MKMKSLTSLKLTPAMPSYNQPTQSSSFSNESTSFPKTPHQGGDQVKPAEQGNAP